MSPSTVKRAGYLDEMFRFGGAVEIAVDDSSTATQATNDETAAKLVEFTGALTADREVVMQQRKSGADWLFKNATTGGFAVTVRGPTGAGVSIAAGETVPAALASSGDFTRTSTAATLDLTKTATSGPRATRRLTGGLTVNEQDVRDVVNLLKVGLDATTRVFSVADPTYGAVGDGVTDDTAAIQAAEAAAYAAGAGIVDLPVPSVGYLITAPITFHSRILFRGHSKGFSAGSRIIVSGAIAAFKSHDQTAIVRDVGFEDLTIDQAGTRPGGSIGVDFTGVSFSTVQRCSFRTHEKAVVGADGGGGAGYYNVVRDCEIVGNAYGVYLGFSANAWRITGGRFQAQTSHGVYTTNCTGNFVHSTFESNAVAIRFATGTSTSEARGYFEANTSGAIIFDSGALRNVERAESLSNSGDFVRDDDGRNFSHSVHSPAQPSARTGYGSGINLLINGDFEVDSDSDGMADGLEMTPSVPAGTTLSLDGTVYKVGAKSQKYAYSATSARTLTRIVKTTIGQRYVFSGWVRADIAGVFRFSLGTDYTDRTSYHFQVLGTAPSQTDVWEFVSVPFVATAATLYIHMDLLTPGGAGAAWMDGFKLEHGALATEHGVDHLLSAARTLGAPLASGSTIAPTHPVHKVTGTTTISTITAPAGFAGEIVLIPTGAWATDTAGNIANVITATANVPVIAVYDPSAAKWYVR